MWQILEPNIETVRRRLAAEFGCSPEEMAITRNASEALQIAQLGIDLKAGDEVVTTNQDYGRMLDTWDQRVRREGITVRKISFPVPPPSMDDLADRLISAIGPKTKVLHFCHITNLTGQIFPVKKICDAARAKGVKTVVDGAHAFAHFPYKAADLGCDFYGTSLHKWLLAPIGTGFLYVRRENIESLWPLTATGASRNKDIRKFEEIGTHPAANHNAIAEALSFHDGMGIERKSARLRYLRNRWADAPAEDRPLQDPHADGSGAVVRHRHRAGARRARRARRSSAVGEVADHRDADRACGVRQASASRRTSTRRSKRSTPSATRWRKSARPS